MHLLFIKVIRELKNKFTPDELSNVLKITRNAIKRLYELTDLTENDYVIQEQIEKEISQNRSYFYEKKRK